MPEEGDDLEQQPAEDAEEEACPSTAFRLAQPGSFKRVAVHRSPMRMTKRSRTLTRLGLIFVLAPPGNYQ